MAEFKVSGMHCNSCVSLVKMNLEDLDGVSKIDADEKGNVKVNFDEIKADVKEIVKKIELDGYKVVNYKMKKI